MILVSTGTNGAAFDRLLQAVPAEAIDEELVVQRGPSALAPSNANCVDYLAYDEYLDLVRRARVVITHAGVGSVLSALMEGKRPLVMPRRARFGEAVDDHQVEFARRLAERGLVVLVEGPADVQAALENGPGTERPAHVGGGRLAADLATYLAGLRRS